MTLREMDRRVTQGVRQTVDVALVKVNIVLAAMMMIFSILEIYTDFNNGNPNPVHILGDIAMIVCAALIILDRDRNLLRTTGLMAVGIGAYRIFMHVTALRPHDIYALPPLIIVILGFNLIYSGTRYIKGIARGRVTLIASMTGMVAMMSTMFIMLMMMGLPLLDCIKMMPNVFAMIALYIMYIGVLDSEPLRTRDLIEIQNKALDGMRRTTTQSPGTGVYEDEAEIILKTFTDKSDWTRIDDGSPVECEYHFRIGDGNEWSYVTMQKWKDSETVHITVSDHDRGTLIHAYRFDADSLLMDGEDVVNSNHITFVGKEGCHDIAIRHVSDHDREEEKYVL